MLKKDLPLKDVTRRNAAPAGTSYSIVSKKLVTKNCFQGNYIISSIVFTFQLKKMKKIVLINCLLLLAVMVQAQKDIPAELERRLQGKARVADIMAEVHAYYDYGRAHRQESESRDEEEFEGSSYDWWRKWEYWAMKRMNPDGTLANHKARDFRAIQEVDARFGNQVNAAMQSLRNANAWASETAANRDNTANRSYGNWSKIGPFDNGSVVNTQTPATQSVDILGVARMDRIAFHPTDANTMYTGSPSGSLFKTTNAGGNWTSIGEGLPHGVACVEVAPSNGNVVYVFTGDGDSHRSGFFVFNYDLSPVTGGMYKSTNGGETWTKCADLYTGTGNFRAYNIAVSQDNANFLLVATSQGIYRTTNGGNSWTQVGTAGTVYYDVEFRPYDDSTVYRSTASTIQYSTGGGRSGTWISSTFDIAPTPTPVRIDLGVRNNNTGAQSTFVYALCSGSTVSGQFSGLYLSADVGVSYVRKANTPNILSSTNAGNDAGDLGDYGCAITVNPNDPNTIATAALNVWRSSNGGTTNQFSSTYRESFGAANQYIHPDIHDVRYNPLNNNLYAATDGGIYRSTDDGATWTNISAGLHATQFYHMKMKDSDGDGDMDGINVIAGAQDNGLKYRTGSGNWVHFYCCDGFDGLIKGSNENYILANLNTSLRRTSDGGATFTNLTGFSNFFSPMAIDYDNDDTMYVATPDGTIRRSFDGFVTSTTLSFNRNNFITTCPSNNARLYGSSSAKTDLSRSEDRGTTWTTISGNAGWPAGSPVLTDCKPWLTNSSEIYVSFGGYTAGTKVYRSIDAGATWTNYSGSLPNVPVHCVATAPEGVYAGTEIGVFFRPDGAADWQPFYTGMPRAVVTDLWVNQNNFIYASTFGHGAWIADRYSACDAVITVSGNITNTQYHEAGTTANATATSSQGANTQIIVKSGGDVNLLPGFEMKGGTEFKAYIGPCGGTPVFRNASVGGGIRNIVEYDDKDQQARRLSSNAYYTVVADGIEISLVADGAVNVELTNANGEIVKVVKELFLTKGMYKILTDGGTNLAVTAGGIPLNKL
jgi:photosystem II stability/assembly factor-like uncharacterized protein